MTGLRNNTLKVVNNLIKKKKTISTMESCTGGGVANAITNICGASEIIKFSAVTYSNEFKIKMGVSKKTIDKYTVYSIEVADEMAKAINDFTSSDYSVGITGQINRPDPNNLKDDADTIYISIYDKKNTCYYHKIIKAINATRIKNKYYIINEIMELLEDKI